MIKVIEVYSEDDENNLQKIKVTTDNKRDRVFDNYPIVIMSKDFEVIEYEVAKKPGHLKDEKSGVLDKAKEKALELKDSVVDATKQSSDDQKS